MNEQPRRSISELLADRDLITAALSRAFREAVLKSARAGHPVSTSQDGKVVWIPAAEILAPYDHPTENQPDRQRGETMNLRQVVVRGTVKFDGTLEVEQPIALPPGPVEVVLRPLTAMPPQGENWWQYLQRARAELEAMGHHFSTGEEINAYIDDLRSGDERIEEAYRAIDEEGSSASEP